MRRQRPWTISTTRYSVRLIGPLYAARVSVDDLDFYYGEPARTRTASGGCHATWPGVGLTATFANYGGGSGPCGTDGRMNDFAIGGRENYGLVRTSAGLRLGDRIAQIRRRYVHARRQGARTWWLRTAHSNVAGGFRYAVLSAQTRNGRITSFHGFVGGAGE